MAIKHGSVVSLFAGIGGFDEGLRRAGWSTITQVEIDPACRNVLARHFPEAVQLEDVTNVSGSDLGSSDLVCGGFPCQDLSVAGRRAGLDGARSGLWWEFHRILSEARPRWCLIENVPGLLSSDGGRDMAAVLGGLGDLGYGFAYRVLDAQWFGVAQRRRRVFIVGCLGDAARAAQVLLEPESCGGHLAPSREAGPRTTADIGDGVADTVRSHPRPGSNSNGNLTVAATLNSGGNNGGFRTEPGEHLVAFHQTQDPISEQEMTPALGATSIGMGVAYNPYRTLEKDGSVTSGFAARPVVDALHGPTGNKEPLVAHPVAVRGRDDGQEWEVGEEPVYNALRAADGGSSRANWMTDGMAVRRLTPKECERLQGFPDDWTAGQPDSTRYRQLGNAVCVPVAEWIGQRLMEAA